MARTVLDGGESDGADSGPTTVAAPRIGRPPKADADKVRGKTWRCTIAHASEVQQRTLRMAGRVLKIRLGSRVRCHQIAQRFAMDVCALSGDVRAFFVFKDLMRREGLERELMADAIWTPAAFAEWPEAARTSAESWDHTHQGSSATRPAITLVRVRPTAPQCTHSPAK